MELYTHVMNSLDIAEDKSKYDTEVKTILSDRDILAWTLKYTTKEFKDCCIDVIKECIEGEPDVGSIPTYPGMKKMDAVTGQNTEDAVPNEGKITYDIRFSVRVPNGERIKILFNVEAQKKYHPGYDLVTRAIFYCARMLSGQMEKEFTSENYDNIKKVYSIWVCMDTPKYAENTITSYNITPQNVYGNFAGKARYDLLSAVMVCLPKENNTSGGNKLHKLLTTVLSEELDVESKKQILKNDFCIETSRELKEGLNLMCNLSDLIAEKAVKRGLEQGMEQGMEQGIKQGIKQGMEQGMEQGMKQGMKQGMEQGKISLCVELVKDGVLSLAEAARRACISEAELKKYF